MIKRPISCVSSFAAGGDVEDLGSAAYKDAGNSSGQVPVLDSNGKLNLSTIPAVAVTDVFTADSEEAMLALDADKGDLCIRSDSNETYLLMDDPATTLSNWVQISNTNSVTSVNNKTGAVTLSYADVGAVAKNTDITGSTKCKITYDSKGLVTAGSDLQASDIPDLSSSYVAANNAITGATKCKITYDSKGLVTAGADLQAADIPDISSSYVATNAAITSATKCKITYDTKGLVTAGADLQASDIPDLSSSYVAANNAITSATKCKITYDTKGLVTAGADLQASDIPDLSSSYVATNDAITSATKCKITYDTKGLVTAGADLTSADLPSHTHSASDITSGSLAVANGGTGATSASGARTNLEVKKEYSLYNNASGTQGTIPLSDSIYNYDKILIYYRDDNWVINTVVCQTPSYGDAIEASPVMGTVSSAGKLYLKATQIQLSGTSVIRHSDHYGTFSIQNNQSVFGDNTSDKIYIRKITGYKY